MSFVRRVQSRAGARRLPAAAWALLLLPAFPAFGEDLEFTILPLPALEIHGAPAKAHTQGLEMVAGHYYVTARRDDVQPRRALLLRATDGGAAWDAWDITPADVQGLPSTLDHPGGMQSDGERLWIPLAESKRGGRSLIRGYPLARLIPGRPLEPEIEFAVSDHIGAVAVFASSRILLGASWDTAAVYAWDFAGRPRPGLTDAGLAARELGVAGGPGGRAGLAVQDWKAVGDRLFASGLFRGPGVAPGTPQSRLVSFRGFFEPEFQRVSVPLPRQHGTELAREGMAVAEGQVYFLPEDLGASNRIFRVSLSDLLKHPAADD